MPRPLTTWLNPLARASSSSGSSFCCQAHGQDREDHDADVSEELLRHEERDRPRLEGCSGDQHQEAKHADAEARDEGRSEADRFRHGPRCQRTEQCAGAADRDDEADNRRIEFEHAQEEHHQRGEEAGCNIPERGRGDDRAHRRAVRDGAEADHDIVAAEPSRSKACPRFRPWLPRGPSCPAWGSARARRRTTGR